MQPDLSQVYVLSHLSALGGFVSQGVTSCPTVNENEGFNTSLDRPLSKSLPIPEDAMVQRRALYMIRTPYLIKRKLFLRAKRQITPSFEKQKTHYKVFGIGHSLISDKKIVIGVYKFAFVSLSLYSGGNKSAWLCG